MQTVQDFCRQVLESGRLEDKLRPPVGEGGSPLEDVPGAPLFIDAPARDDALRMREGGERLPRLSELRDGAARAACLDRFAHHELCAVELFAFALLAFPNLPPPLRRSLLITLAEEQAHLRLYLERLAALGSGLGEHGLSDYLWRHAPAIARSERPELAFLCAMGLTFEQANLDFSLLYRDAFWRAGDEESATVMQRVHDDEVRHVRLAVRWVPRLDGRGRSDVEVYEEAVPFPLSAARAKARRFDAAARRKAGLSEAFIARVEKARPSHQLAPRR